MIPIAAFPQPGQLTADPPQRREARDLPTNEDELKQLTHRAEAGDASAQFDLAYFYSAYAERKIAYFKEHIPSGSPNMRAPYNIVEKDYFSELVREEREKAFAWYKRAAEQGLSEAIYELSGCFRRGEGTPIHLEKAKELLMQAAEKGYAPAQYDVGIQFYFGKPKSPSNAVEVPPNYEKAVLWLKKSAAQGYVLAQYYLGICYEEGKGLEQDFGEAFRLFENAAQSELLWAMCALGRCYELGRSIEVNLGKAVEWYTLAAENGDAEAAEALERLGY